MKKSTQTKIFNETNSTILSLKLESIETSLLCLDTDVQMAKMALKSVINQLGTEYIDEESKDRLDKATRDLVATAMKIRRRFLDE